MNGLSVIVCCYNSAHVLAETLRSLAHQEINPVCDWELILVDNASTDNTASIAQHLWTSFQTTQPIHIVTEKRPGLSFARETGINQAIFDIVLFCDDDNILDAHYFEKGIALMSQLPQVAMLGGKGIAQSKNPSPIWFDRYSYHFAVGTQANEPGDITLEKGYVYGAGSFLRLSHYYTLKNSGFVYTLTGRKGKSLLSGEDNELGYALSLIGFHIYYDEQLHFQHILPSNRITLAYLKKLKRAVAYSSILLIPYIEKRNNLLLHQKPSFNWYKKIAAELFYFVNGLLRYPFASKQFRIDILLDQQSRIGSITGLLNHYTYLSNKNTWLPWLKVK
jgi:glycosyltransferase involved in cell wall biosynthesis